MQRIERGKLYDRWGNRPSKIKGLKGGKGGKDDYLGRGKKDRGEGLRSGGNGRENKGLQTSRETRKTLDKKNRILKTTGSVVFSLKKKRGRGGGGGKKRRNAKVRLKLV